ncbi:MAG: hypothetical protein IKX00_05430 [Bacilli bacterium]|nr:hypothetical protein [Bacilli bacterium]
MKKINLLVASFVFSLCIFVGTSSVYAKENNLEDNANPNNVKEVSLTENNARISTFLSQATPALKEIYNEQPFILGEEWFDENGNLYPIKDFKVKYIETSTYIDGTNSNNNVTRQRILTADEYNNWTPNQTRSSCEYWGAADCWETTAKRIVIIYQTYPSEQAKVLNQWKTLPTVRSYDTIGLLYNNFTMTSASGRQWYNTSSNPSTNQYIDYSYNGTNMKISTTGQKGVSVSQNIVDNAYTVLQNDLYVYGTQGNYMQMAGSYQHAVNDIDLATSKNFTFDAWGMGKVFNWNVSWSNWDGMQGVCFNWSNYLWTC